MIINVPGSAKTLQSAINMAKNGDTIVLENISIEESVVLHRQLTNLIIRAANV